MTSVPPRVWRFPGYLRAFAVLDAVGFNAIAFAPGDKPWWADVFFSVFGLCFGAGFLWPRVVLTADELEIRNWYKPRRVTLAEIVAVRPGRAGLAITRIDGSVVYATALQKGIGTQLLRIRTRTDDACDAITASAPPVEDPRWTPPSTSAPRGANKHYRRP
jgi:Bacterial PH domain